MQTKFETAGPTWSERGDSLPGLTAVYDPKNYILSKWLGLVYNSCLADFLKHMQRDSIVLDFGCGIGHQTELISENARFTIGMDVTPEMLSRARRERKNKKILYVQIDGHRLPITDNSVEAIWTCGVLRYSLFSKDPKHHKIVEEFNRILKKDGVVYNIEMHVDAPIKSFTTDFTRCGLTLVSAKIINIHQSWIQKNALSKKYRRILLRKWWAYFAVLASRFWKPKFNGKEGSWDYLFVYRKPN